MPSIHADQLTVEFPIHLASSRSLKKAFLNATTGGRLEREPNRRVTVTALDRASFDIQEGERIGLIGHNGSGKTTLLRVLAGAYEPVRGTLRMKGRVVSLLDLSLGMDPEGTGFENMLLRGIIMGLTPREIRARMDEMAEFTELGDYLNMPIRTYSSGMQLRLAFAVATSLHADILLMDEWLSVGDESFKDKARKRLQDLVDRSSILVLASHSKDLVGQICTRALTLEHGSIAADVQLT